MGGWDQVRDLLTFFVHHHSKLLLVLLPMPSPNVVAVAAAASVVVVIIILILITQSYCESISISCNGWYWFGIFVNGTNCHGVIAAIKRKQSNEYYTKSHTIFMHHEILRFDDSKSVAIFTQEKIRFRCTANNWEAYRTKLTIKINSKWCARLSLSLFFFPFYQKKKNE